MFAKTPSTIENQKEELKQLSCPSLIFNNLDLGILARVSLWIFGGIASFEKKKHPINWMLFKRLF